MSPSAEPRVQSYVRLVRAAEALHHQVSRGLAEHGLSASQFSTLKALRIHGRLSQRDIAKYILKSGGNITILVDNLEAMDLATRDRDTKDRRIVYVQLTKKGEDLFDSIYPTHVERIRQAMSLLSAAESARLMELLSQLSPKAVGVPCETEAA